MQTKNLLFTIDFKTECPCHFFIHVLIHCFVLHIMQPWGEKEKEQGDGSSVQIYKYTRNCTCSCLQNEHLETHTSFIRCYFCSRVCVCVLAEITPRTAAVMSEMIGARALFHCLLLYYSFWLALKLFHDQYECLSFEGWKTMHIFRQIESQRVRKRERERE